MLYEVLNADNNGKLIVGFALFMEFVDDYPLSCPKKQKQEVIYYNDIRVLFVIQMFYMTGNGCIDGPINNTHTQNVCIKNVMMKVGKLMHFFHID